MAFLMLCYDEHYAAQGHGIGKPHRRRSGNRKTPVKDPASPKQFDPTIQGTVEFRDVSFRYPDAEADVLKDISFTAHAGKPLPSLAAPVAENLP